MKKHIAQLMIKTVTVPIEVEEFETVDEARSLLSEETLLKYINYAHRLMILSKHRNQMNKR